MTTESYFAVHATASTEIATAYGEKAWDALLAGDLDAALTATPKYINTKTGEKVSRVTTLLQTLPLWTGWDGGGLGGTGLLLARVHRTGGFPGF